MEVAVTLEPATPAVRVDLTLVPADTVTLAGLRPTVTHRALAGPVQARWVVRPTRWGRRSAGVLIVSLRTVGGLTEAVTAVAIGQLSVFPSQSLLRTLIVPPSLPDQIGAHVSRATGSGVEFAGVRPYIPETHRAT